MEYIIVTYGSTFTLVLDIIVKHNITLNECCNSEVLDVLPNVKFRGQYKINIVYPSTSDDVMKKLFGRSDCIHVDKLLHNDDIRRMEEHFGRLNLSFKNITYKGQRLFNIKTLEYTRYILKTDINSAKEEVVQNIVKLSFNWIKSTS